MDLLIISGFSGAGKSTAIRCLEDMGYYCIDNLPAPLLEPFLEALIEQKKDLQEEAERFALVIDVRSVRRFGDLGAALQRLQASGRAARILFFEADERILLSRYKQSRRSHPLAKHQSLSRAISEEAELLVPVRALATDILDTSDMTAPVLREKLYQLLRAGHHKRLRIFIQSFGFKYGVPLDCDTLWDVRFMPNPYYDLKLRALSGRDDAVRDFVFQFSETQEFMKKQRDFFCFALPYYQREGKVRLHIAIGCTGGRHRSVAIAEALSEELRQLDYEVELNHRDLPKDPQGGL